MKKAKIIRCQDHLNPKAHENFVRADDIAHLQLRITYRHEINAEVYDLWASLYNGNGQWVLIYVEEDISRGAETCYQIIDTIHRMQGIDPQDDCVYSRAGQETIEGADYDLLDLVTK